MSVLLDICPLVAKFIRVERAPGVHIKPTMGRVRAVVRNRGTNLCRHAQALQARQTYRRYCDLRPEPGADAWVAPMAR